MAFNTQYVYSFKTSNNWDWKLKIRTAHNSTNVTYTDYELPSAAIRIKSCEYGWEKAPIGIPENLVLDLIVNLSVLNLDSTTEYLKQKLYDSFQFTSNVMYYNVFILECNYGTETYEVFSITAQKPTIERIFAPGELVETLEISTVCVSKLVAESTTIQDMNLGFVNDEIVSFTIPNLQLFDYIFSSNKRISSRLQSSVSGDAEIQLRSMYDMNKRITDIIANKIRGTIRNVNATFPSGVISFLSSLNDNPLTSIKFYRHLYNDTGKANFSSEIDIADLYVMTNFLDKDGISRAGWTLSNDTESWNMNYKNLHNALQDLTEAMFCKGVYKTKLIEGYYFGYIEYSEQLPDYDSIFTSFDINQFSNLRITQGMNTIRNAKFNIKERTGGNINAYEVDNRFSKAENDFNLKNVTFNVTADNVSDDAYTLGSNVVLKRIVRGSKLYSLETIDFLSGDPIRPVRVGDGCKVSIDGVFTTFQPTDDFDVSSLNDVNNVKIEIAKRQQQGSIFDAICNAYLNVFGDYMNAEIEGTISFNSENVFGGSIERFIPYNIGKRLELIDSDNLTASIKNTSGAQLVPAGFDPDTKFVLKKVVWNFESETVDLTIFAR